MLISDSGSDREFKLAPAGVHMAICYGVVDLGTQGYVTVSAGFAFGF